jgi:DNA-binding transcriptional regulator YiaG
MGKQQKNNEIFATKEKKEFIPSDDKQKEIVKKTVKDSVFCNLFKDTKYVLELYQALHPEDTGVTKEDISNVTLTNILLDQMYNDLGFMVGDRQVLLVEAQSTWSLNIIIRSLLYLAQTWNEHIERTEQNVYKSTKVSIPKPELYVVYTGNRKTRPEWIYLSKEFFGDQDSFVEAKVKMIYDGKGNDIIHQYVTFTKIYNEQVTLYGRTRKAVLETIRICKDRDILREYLKSRESEVMNIMMTVFDQEHAFKMYVEDEKREAAEQAEMNIKRETAFSLADMGLSSEKIAEAVNVSVDTVKQWLECSAAIAK